MAIITDIGQIMEGHARAAIAGLPVTIIFEGGEEVQASFKTSDAGVSVVAEDGGPVFDRGGTLVIARTDMPENLQENDLLRIVQRDSSEKVFELYFIGGSENPTVEDIWLSVGPPNK